MLLPVVLVIVAIVAFVLTKESLKSKRNRIAGERWRRTHWQSPSRFTGGGSQGWGIGDGGGGDPLRAQSR